MPPLIFNQFHDTGKENLAVNPGKFVRSIGKVFSYISQGQCSEQCIAQSVDSHVSVRVGYTSYRAFYFNASEPQRQPLSKCVDVISVTYSQFHMQIISTNVNKKP